MNVLIGTVSKFICLDTLKERLSSNATPSEPTLPYNSESYVDDVSLLEDDSEGKGRRTQLLELLRWWWLEALSCAVLVGDLVALIATVAGQDGKPLKTWSLGVNINGLVAIYSIILRAASALILSEGLGQLKWSWFRLSHKLSEFADFDQATRGPWGALAFVFRSRGRPILASFGSLFILASLITDPFAQQLVSFADCQVASAVENATTSRTSYYNGIPIDPYELDIKNAVNRAVYAGRETSAVPTSCRGGNCTFQPFLTLGMCSSCTDASSQVQLSNETYAYHQNVSFSLKFNQEALDQGDTMMISFLKDRKPLSSSYVKYYAFSVPVAAISLGNIGSGGRWYQEFLVLVGSVQLEEFEQVRQAQQARREEQEDQGDREDREGQEDQENQEDLADLVDLGDLEDQARQASERQKDIYHYVPGHSLSCNEHNNNTWQCQNQGAARCLIMPCVRNMSTIVLNGVISETTLDEIPIPDTMVSEATRSIIANHECLPYHQNKSVTGHGMPLPEHPSWFRFRADSLKELEQDDMKLSVVSRCGYDFDDGHRISTFLAPYLEGNSSVNYGYAGDNENGPLERVSPSTSPLVDHIFQAGNVTFDSINATFANIANSLTALIRSSGVPGEYSEPALGVVWVHQTCTKVRWAWMVYPCVLVSLVISFFIAVMIEGATKDRTGWKTSILPVLFHGLDKPPYDMAKRLNDKSEMEKGAKDISVRLARTAQGWKLVESGRKVE